MWPWAISLLFAYLVGFVTGYFTHSKVNEESEDE